MEQVKAKYIQTPLTEEKTLELKAGDQVYISGIVYTARDAAHKRMIEELEVGKDLPFDIKDSTIYYTGPCPPRPGEIIGSSGPTTSYRMDSYTPTLLDRGLRGMIGKGERSKEVISSMIKNKSVYFAVIGGAGALISSCIKEVEVIAYEDLGTEAIRKIYIENMPAIVAIDSQGNSLFERGE
ncbi:putative L(+)-tartrate dehydratase, subunit beta [Gottschalkia acidurici 9a]|uniref:L(+)-tartrate dehydratase, subunit beta n=1 Tax=Gottschalkia acidurici (strain ATCC 7906 / DSM 604 / BCRC 14475 / CIP 104303 / KCTC 5404 / NCIMB 10678 / 9a) TaxID=1128398 RepID=K0AWN8_GOTA9|nr:Fe-S-containing hydro-lyase [Gottschalkia acidurici]AFS77187.1 putative L(+)-tartrate dehydratase, subunit beta [Gottschalkia acidurici 9a]